MIKKSQAYVGWLLIATAINLTGCATPAQNPTNINRTAQGAYVGAAAGALIGGGTTLGIGIPIGAGAGAVLGAVGGGAMDEWGSSITAITPYAYPDINFYFNSSKIFPGYYSELDLIATTLKSYPNTMVKIAGYTDTIGEPMYNKKLGDKRAKQVANYLIAHGISPQRIQTMSYGELYPLVPTKNQSTVSRHFDRRVHIVLQAIEQNASQRS